MDKNAIKKYAVWARRELIYRVSQKAYQYGIRENDIIDANADSIDGKILTNSEKRERRALIAQVTEKGFDQVMEEVAYTWFNRFSALRFMEVNGYLPTHVRVFTDEGNNFKPQIITEAIHMELDGLDMDKVYALKEEDDNEELFKYLVITQCNALNEILPGMFQKIADYTELLFPDNLLRKGSIIEQMIMLIPEEDFDIRSGGQVEIIGWLYQYYNDELKNEVININKGAVKREDIPAATQLFTTDWVVRYIIDNSLGRYWMERNPNSSLKDELDFYVTPKDGAIATINEKVTPEELSVFDPCMGSAHFLIYAFEVLMKIYTEYGYSERDATKAIVENNLYGLDIDERASQLAYFALMMKARQYDRRFLTRGMRPHVHSICESNHIDPFCVEYFVNGNVKLKTDMQVLIDEMKDAKEYGSIIKLSKVDFDAFFARFDEIKNDISIYREATLSDLLPLVQVAKNISLKYVVVATNPPYLNRYNSKMKKFVTTNYKDYSGDLFSVFMYRNFDYCKRGGYSGFMTPFVWMFIKTYEKLRKYIINGKSITALVQMEYSAFEEATVPICSFVLKNGMDSSEGLYMKLSDFKGGMSIQEQKVREAIVSKECKYFYQTEQDNFLKIPGAPVAYWLSETSVENFLKASLLSDEAEIRQGLATSDNNKYLRLWFEINKADIDFHSTNIEVAKNRGYRWFPFNKGGAFRKWYGNQEYVVDYKDDGADMKSNVLKKYPYLTTPDFVVKNTAFYFLPSITWTEISSTYFGVRYCPPCSIFSNKSNSIFPDSEDDTWYLLAFLCSKPANLYIKAFNPTITTNVGDVAKLPIIKDMDQFGDGVTIVKNNIQLSKNDWNAFETSWDFEKHPLIKPYGVLEDIYNEWDKECEQRFSQLKVNEELLNRIFIDIYSLQDELTPEVEAKDVTIRKADLQRDIKSLISYAVGCMFGRYSLDMEGLAYTGNDWDASKYRSYPADADNIIPICDDEYFDDDIYGRFVKFVKIVYGAANLEGNLKFIADALDGKGSSRDVIRSYFINNFYTDHCKMYQKRPIYWLFDSGKKNGFKALIYMHRYQPDTIARMRTDYVHEQQERFRTAITHLEERINNAPTSERVKLNKHLGTLKDQATEIRVYEEKIHHLADQMIHIDLDDGVKKNYEIFKDVLAKIK